MFQTPHFIHWMGMPTLSQIIVEDDYVSDLKSFDDDTMKIIYYD